MKKTTLMAIGILLLPTILMLSPQAKAHETIIFEDGFDSYPIGQPPPDPPWDLVYTGERVEVTNSYCVSPDNSLMLQGSPGYSALVKRDFTSSSDVIGFEVYMMASDNASDSSNANSAGFYRLAPERFYARAVFTNGTIKANNDTGAVDLQSFEPNKWYKIRIMLNKTTRRFNVWIDDVLKGQNLLEQYDPDEILSLQLSTGWVSTLCYFDNVKVFSAERCITLMPSAGFASTTIIGQAFSFNSKVTITWDGILIPTVPYNLIADATGCFTAIISVPTQTTPGTHVINATDEDGHWATATFTVVNMTGTQGLQGLAGPPGPKGENGTQGPPGPAGNMQELIIMIAFPAGVSILALCIAIVALLKRKP